MVLVFTIYLFMHLALITKVTYVSKNSNLMDKTPLLMDKPPLVINNDVLIMKVESQSMK